MPGSSSTSKIFAVCFIDVVFLCWGPQQPVYTESETKTCNLRPDHFRPIFYRPSPVPGGARLPDLIPSPPDFRCREGGKSRRKLLNEIPREFQGPYRPR